jgi:serine/threonine protein kinase
VLLAPGTELGPFEIVRLLGAGGMGEVYAARDRQMNRSVALKVLRSDVAKPHRHARFEREALAASALNHPNICHTYSRGETPDGRPYITMEYVEGETLDQRFIEPLSLRDALDIAIQIAAALAAAHSAGIVHRDVKPGNVIVRPDRLVKVLDFGLAKLLPSAAAFTRHGPTQPTTETASGSLIGTPHYMSPEQARGHDVDARTDIWALGALLYEMVAHRPPFTGSTRADVLVSVLDREAAPLTDLAPDVPPELQRIVRKALRKDPEQRYQVIKDLLLDLEALRDEVATTDRVKIHERRLVHRRAASSMVAALVIGALLVFGYAARRKNTPITSAQRFSSELGMPGNLPATDVPLALSPDGTLVAFVARTRTTEAPQLYVRRLDQLTATPLDGTSGASTPCFSPDGQWLAFFAELRLKKVPVTGGAVVTVAETPQPRGAWWAEDGTIVFAPHNRKGLMRVSSRGGEVQPVTTLTEGEITHRFPQVLPGGVGILYTANTELMIGRRSTLVVQRLPSGERTIVQRGAYFGRYSGGHILYMQDDTLLAVPFDLRRLTVTGPPARIIDGIQSDDGRGSAQLALSQTGMMAYIPGRNRYNARPIAWMDRTGTLTTLRAAAAEWYNAEFSPEGRRIALDIRGGGQTDIWVHDWSRGSLDRITSTAMNEEFPVWTPDGAYLAYRSFKSSTDPYGYTISWKRADGAGDAQVLIHSTGALLPGSWHPNKKVLAYVATMPETDEDVMILPVEGDEVGGWKPGKPVAFVSSAARERAPTFSPDGRWLAYTSNESGHDEVYVRPFPGPGSRVMVSSGGGHSLSWSRARHEIVFTAEAVDYAQVLMVARYRVEHDSFLVDKPRLWAERAQRVRQVLGSRMYALHPDGARVAIAPPSEREMAAPTHLTFVLNLSDELRRIAPPKP